ncbi:MULTISPECIES: MFS transporter [unclassified Streptococcus]|uniref:MFS transporter n=2 Tax=Bacteria TaxID=2 RepID=UPI0008A3DED6|nr:MULTISPECIES: MFS transporter [unclassified Streptococcus]OFK37869.1 MFS transporter [Streptococcus sp. HMSC076H09]OFL27276.1 MFS transporter [Streptococcus sp. HMSC076H08]OFO74316.1 MFS transporter [Streptococcus sp. HMSC076H10]OFQ16144.1 MFS transporter [Streptococcus sp. HMSC076H07]
MNSKLSLKLTILSISIFLMSHLAIAPAIPKLYAFYHTQNPHIGLASVESLVTIPAMMITIFVILSNFVVTKLGKKNTVLLGLCLILISGFISFFTSNFSLAMASRLLLGIGIGLYNSLSISIITDLYEADERASMIGLRTASLNIGKALTTFIVGLVLAIGVNYIYLVYLLVIPVFFFFFFWKNVPEVENQTHTLKASTTFDTKAALLMFITFLVGIAYIGATVKIPTLLVTKYHYATSFSSNMLTLLAFSGILVGSIFGKLVKVFQEKTLLIMILAMGIGNVLFALANNQIIFIVASILIGASFVGTMSSVFFYISKNYAKEHNNFITSLALTAGNIGVILTPLILTKLPSQLHLEPFMTPFLITSGLMVINVFVYLVLMSKNK